jgi:hypothetical protein
LRRSRRQSGGYEEIGGDQTYRSDLTLMYLLTLDPERGRLVQMRLVPMQVRCFRLNKPSEADTRWLCERLNKLGVQFKTQVQLDGVGMILRWRVQS